MSDRQLCANPRRRRAALPALALAVLALAGCASFSVQVAPAAGEQPTQSLRSLFFIVGRAQELEAVNLPDFNPMEMLSLERQSKYFALLEFEPKADAKGAVTWRQRNEPTRDPGIRIKQSGAQIRLSLDSSFVESHDHAAVLVIADFTELKPRFKLFESAEIVAKNSFAFTLANGDLVRQP